MPCNYIVMDTHQEKLKIAVVCKQYFAVVMIHTHRSPPNNPRGVMVGVARKTLGEVQVLGYFMVGGGGCPTFMSCLRKVMGSQVM